MILKSNKRTNSSIYAMIVILLFISQSQLSAIDVDENLSNYDNELKLNQIMKTSSSQDYVEETLTTSENVNRAKYMSYTNDNGDLSIVHYDEYDEKWYLREYSNGSWTVNLLGTFNHPAEFVQTDFGLFNVEIVYSNDVNQICDPWISGSRLVVNMTIINISNNGNVHVSLEFCVWGAVTSLPGNLMPVVAFPASASDRFFSLAMTSCRDTSITNSYSDDLFTIFANGSIEMNSFQNRYGSGGNPCGAGVNGGGLLQSPSRAIVTNNNSCISNHGAQGIQNIWSDNLNKLRITCLDFNNNSEISLETCPTTHVLVMCNHYNFHASDDRLYIWHEEATQANPWTFTPHSEVLNESSYTDLTTNWMPQNCQSWVFQESHPNGVPVYVEYPVSFNHLMHIRESAMVCQDTEWGTTLNPGTKIWNYVDNSTSEIPANFDFEDNFVSFNTDINIVAENWIGLKKNIFDGYDLVILWADYDQDSYHNLVDTYPFDSSQWSDVDGDGYGDNLIGNNPDSCPGDYGTSYIDLFGCVDSDSDGWSNSGDNFPFEPTQWADSDSDGFGDEVNGTQGDDCPLQFGTSDRDLLGCIDSDYDGWSDIGDAFPTDSSQWADSDLDGFGDLLNGYQGDYCPDDYGMSYIDVFGCIDSDSDGWSNLGDSFPFEPTQWSDIDGDGYGDNQNGEDADVFPNNPTQWSDNDGDGFGDNGFGLQGDLFPEDPTQESDRDGDGFGDNLSGNNPDQFPSNPMQWYDTDGDGYGDNPFGLQGDGCPTEAGDSFQDLFGCPDTDGDGVSDQNDAFPLDPDYWLDSDRDGVPDSLDDYPFDSTQWSDADGDGWGDNPTGPLADAFPDDPTQWSDTDGDGLGENPEGDNPDPFLNDFDNDGFNDSVDILPSLPSPGDLDNDGVLDIVDLFPSNPLEWLDNDMDGIGDNADADDDNDGWTDVDENRQGTDSLDSSEVPIDPFQLILPGTNIGLDAWDLIGIFGGGPIFIWILFGFVTRNRRTNRIIEHMESSQSRKELEDIAKNTEFLLMLRLLGTHQGIRLERVRAELDDIFEAFEGSAYENFDQTAIVTREIESEKDFDDEDSKKNINLANSNPASIVNQDSEFNSRPVKLPDKVVSDLMDEEVDPEIDDLAGFADEI